MVVENNNVWFEDGAPLTLRVCEDTRQPDDLSLQTNSNCKICDDAKYEVSKLQMVNEKILLRIYNDYCLYFIRLVGPFLNIFNMRFHMDTGGHPI